MKKIYLLFLVLIVSGCLLGCGNKEIHVPGMANSYVGSDWHIAQKDFKEAGFVNIVTEEIKDVDEDSIFSDGCVEKISINGDSNFDLDSKYEKESEVLITYHTLVEHTANIHVNFIGNLLLSKYDVDFYVDDSIKGTMEHGEDADYELTLPIGEHVISFVNHENADVKGENALNVTSDLEVSYTISCNSEDISAELDFIDYKVDVPEGKTKLAISEKDLRNVNYEEAISKLNEMGFSNIETKILYDIFWGVTDDGSVESVTIDGKDNLKKGEIFSSDAKVVVTYHTLEENDPNTADSDESKGTEVDEDTKSAEETEKPIEEDETVLAYVMSFQDYEVYYVINLKNKTAKYGTSYDEAPSEGVFTSGDNLNDGIDVTFYQGTADEYTDRIHWHYENADSTLILIDANGYESKFRKTSMSLIPDIFW